MTLTENGTLTIVLSDGSSVDLGNIKGEKGDKGDPGETGAQGEKGDPGETGSAGRGISSTEIVNGMLIVTYTDGTKETVGSVSAGGNGILDAEGGTVGLCYWPLNDGTYGVSIGSAGYVNTIYVPKTHNGVAVSRIMNYGFQLQYSGDRNNYRADPWNEFIASDGTAYNKYDLYVPQGIIIPERPFYAAYFTLHYYN